MDTRLNVLSAVLKKVDGFVQVSFLGTVNFFVFSFADGPFHLAISQKVNANRCKKQEEANSAGGHAGRIFKTSTPLIPQ